MSTNPQENEPHSNNDDSSKEPELKELSLARACTGSLIELVTEHATFRVHKGLLDTVPYFRTLFKSSWSPNQKKVFLEEESWLVGIFVHWLYRQEIDPEWSPPPPRADSKSWADQRTECPNGTFEGALAECYKFADKMLATNFKNDIVDFIRAGHGPWTFVGLCQLPDVYEHQCPNNGLLKFHIRSAAWWFANPSIRKGSQSPLEEKIPLWYLKDLLDHPDLALEFLQALDDFGRGIVANPNSAEAACEFHDHSDGSSCPPPPSSPERSQRAQNHPNTQPTQPAQTTQPAQATQPVQNA